jgi:hypothetical protein
MRTVIRKIVIGLTLALFLAGVATTMLPKQAAATSGSDFRADRIIDDSIFFDSNSMSATDVQAFLNSKVPVCSNAPCLKDFQTDMDYFAPDAYCGGVNAARKSAATIIKDVSVACGISPKVIIVLLEKEQSLVTSTAPSSYKYEYATGFCVPDGPPPPACAGTYGFANQVYYGARQYQKYAKDPGSYTFRAGQVNSIQYHPNGGCGSTNIFIQNQATAGLYNYTPYQPNAAALANLYGLGDSCSAYGNRNFWRLFSDWFASTLTDKCNYNAPGIASTNQLFHKYNRYVDTADFTIYSGTSTNCIESHVWNTGMQSWQAHIASNQPVVNYPDLQVLYGDLDGSGYDYPVLFGVRNTSTGLVEAHVWNRNMKSYLAHTATNQAAIDPGDCKIILADLDGRGKDDTYLICEQNTSSGKIEVHKWNPGLQTWAWHNITNMNTVDPSKHNVVAGDINADGKDDLILVAYSDTGSNKVEFHVWNPGLWSWRSHIASNLDEIDQNNAKVEMADIDGNGVEEAVLVAFRNTGSGKIEFHVWHDGFGVWRQHIASNQPTP